MRVQSAIGRGNQPDTSARLSQIGHWWRSEARTVVTNAGALFGTTMVNSGLGFVYWWVAARRFAPASVGFAAAAISLMTLLGTASMLGLGTLLIGELPRRRGQAGSMVAAALVVVGIVGVLLGGVAAFITGRAAGNLGALGGTLAGAALFAIGVSVTAVTLVLDQALVGLLRGGYQLGRNAIFAAIKLAALIAVGLCVARASGLTIYATWVVGALVSLLALIGLALAKGHGIREAVPRVRLLSGLSRSALSHHLLNLSLQAPGQVLPVIVAAMLSATLNAYFYATWMIASFVFAVPGALSVALYAAVASDPAKVARRFRLTASIAAGTGILATVAFLLFGRVLLGVFGTAYAAHASGVLVVLGLAVFPQVIKVHYVAMERIGRRTTRAAIVMTAGAGVEVVLAVLGGRSGGLMGLSLGWLAALCLEALCVLMPVARVVIFRQAAHLEGRMLGPTALPSEMLSAERQHETGVAAQEGQVVEV